MAKSHPIISYARDIIIGGGLVLVVLACVGYGRKNGYKSTEQVTGRVKEDPNNPVVRGNHILETDINVAKSYANKQYPGITSIPDKALGYTKSHLVKVSNVHMDDAGDGYLTAANGKTYSFQLAGITGVPSNSEFHKYNQANMQAVVQKLISGKSMRMSRNGNGIDLYANGVLVQDSLLKRGLVYADATKPMLHTGINDEMLVAQKYAQHEHNGLWRIPNVIRVTNGTPTYNTQADASYGEHHRHALEDVSENSVNSSGGFGGQSLGSSIASWFDRH